MLAVIAALPALAGTITIVAGADSAAAPAFSVPMMSKAQLVSQCRGLFTEEANDSGAQWAGFGWGPVQPQSAKVAFVIRSTTNASNVVLSGGPRHIGYVCTLGSGGGPWSGTPIPVLKDGQRLSLDTWYQGPHEPEAGFVVITRTAESVRMVSIVLSDGQTVRSHVVDGYIAVSFQVPFVSGQAPTVAFGEEVGFSATGKVVAIAPVKAT